jgi:SWI/SNF-related matrix-associated actin-dependent regulator 1 of chromatin subfamily A
MTKLYDYQKKGVLKIEKFKGRALLADEMGLGKTIQALFYHKRNKKGTTIVICPASLKYNWAREAAIHIGEHAEVIEGRKPPQSVGFNQSQFIIINYEVLHSWVKHLRKLKPTLVILDECHYIKNRAAKRTKAVKALCKGIKEIIAISGTPLTNRPAELFPILNLLKPSKFKAFMPYAMKYCNARKTPWGWDFKGSKNLNELHKTLTKLMMVRRRKKDVLKDLPEKSRHVVTVPISNRKEYDEAEDDLIAWLAKYSVGKARRAEAAERLVKMGYLKRLAAELKIESVVEWIRNFLEETDGKLVVFGIHKKIIERIESEFKNSVSLTGNTKSKERQMVVDKFQNDPSTRLFIGNLQAAGVGLTLTSSSTVLFVELGWTPSEHTQGEDRIHRIGQRNAAACYYMIADNTIEEKLSEIIQNKQSILTATLDGGETKEDLTIFDELQKELIS